MGIRSTEIDLCYAQTVSRPIATTFTGRFTGADRLVRIIQLFGGSSMCITLALNNWASIFTILGVVIAAVALIFTACQVHKNTLVNRGQFWLELEKMFSQHDKVHMNLRPGGKWSSEGTGPENVKEWVKVEDYMGLFEHCEIMLQKKLIDEDTFGAIFSYRLQNIVDNKQIVQAKLVDERESWDKFNKLLKRYKIKVC